MKIDEIYSLRNNFSIIGLTGRTGSGCSRFSKIISESIRYDKNNMVRRPEDILYLNSNVDENPLPDNNTLFKRKYTICYDYFKKNNQSYKTISYVSVLIFYSIHYGVQNGEVSDRKSLIDFLYKIIEYNFKKSEIGLDNDYLDIRITKDELS